MRLSGSWTTPRNGRGFYLDLRTIKAHTNAGRAAATAVDAAGVEAGYAARCGGNNPVKRFVDVRKALGSLAYRQVGEVDIHRQARHIPVEQIDGGPAFESEHFLLCDEGQQADEKGDLGGVDFTGHRHHRPYSIEQTPPVP